MEKKPLKRLQLSKDELEKVAQAKKRAEASTIEVEPEWHLIAEFGYYYGWQGVEAIMNNDIDPDQLDQLLLGARKVWYKKLYEQSSASFAAHMSTKTKKPAQSFTKAMKTVAKAAGVK